jgi:hypothetical protein
VAHRRWQYGRHWHDRCDGRLHRRLESRTAAFDDADLAFGFGDFEFRHVRFGHEVDQGLEFAQIHGVSCIGQREVAEFTANSLIIHLFRFIYCLFLLNRANPHTNT